MVFKKGHKVIIYERTPEIINKLKTTWNIKKGNGYNVSFMKGIHKPWLSKRMKENNPMKNLETRKKVSNTLKDKYKKDIIISPFQNQTLKFRKQTSERMKNGGAIKARMAVKYNRISKVELKLKQILQNINIKFVQQYPIDRYSVDFYLPDYNLIIEADGEYWHNYPNYTPKDLEKSNYIMKKGYFGIRFWEREINNEINCKNLILQTINNISEKGCICK